ncbi:MAG: UDP-2,3-diacylglucosamine diphosphatase [Gammaproteobacteria bacterium]|nr:UDP-2,3-diacylglucosamine diphosphatase [Gammaproteobacteria bacterium]
MPTLFISDLHLCKDRPQINELFLNFLTTDTKEIHALYILGDLFEVWIGDDVVTAEDKIILAALKSVTQSGIPVYVMHGNRDFFLAEQFCEQTGSQIIADPSIIDLYGTPTLIMHGDTLCTDDTSYQQFRSMVRSEIWQTQFLAMTPEQRQKIATKYRNESKIQTKLKEAKIIDANQQTIETVMQENNVLHLIHGHTHRPGTHHFQLNNNSAQRVVLGDWYEHGSVLIVDKSGYDLKTLER